LKHTHVAYTATQHTTPHFICSYYTL